MYKIRSGYIEMMESKRELVKGHLRPPPSKAKTLSYTQAPASKDEVSVRRNKEKDILGKMRYILLESSP
jgi:hypothetical protein